MQTVFHNRQNYVCDYEENSFLPKDFLSPTVLFSISVLVSLTALFSISVLVFKEMNNPCVNKNVYVRSKNQTKFYWICMKSYQLWSKVDIWHQLFFPQTSTYNTYLKIWQANTQAINMFVKTQELYISLSDFSIRPLSADRSSPVKKLVSVSFVTSFYLVAFLL